MHYEAYGSSNDHLNYHWYNGNLDTGIESGGDWATSSVNCRGSGMFAQNGWNSLDYMGSSTEHKDYRYYGSDAGKHELTGGRWDTDSYKGMFVAYSWGNYTTAAGLGSKF